MMNKDKQKLVRATISLLDKVVYGDVASYYSTGNNEMTMQDLSAMLTELMTDPHCRDVMYKALDKPRRQARMCAPNNRKRPRLDIPVIEEDEESHGEDIDTDEVRSDSEESDSEDNVFVVSDDESL